MLFSDIKEKLKNLTQKPGVYLMKDSDGNIIYVGKAKNLKNRVSQYFNHLSSHTVKVLRMIENINDFDYIILINSSDENKLKRVLAKGKLSADEINKRIANQIPDEEKKEAVDFVFDNNGSLDDLKQKVSIFLIILKSLTEKN